MYIKLVTGFYFMNMMVLASISSIQIVLSDENCISALVSLTASLSSSFPPLRRCPSLIAGALRVSSGKSTSPGKDFFLLPSHFSVSYPLTTLILRKLKPLSSVRLLPHDMG
ncbi:hypothetical protein RAMDARK_1295 [Rickettsia amblyommatis str. Darkwater]|nr:hypothetical protein RAMDARK_1295 [Rickettsia amblyommatis str. Darkwater]